MKVNSPNLSVCSVCSVVKSWTDSPQSTQRSQRAHSFMLAFLLAATLTIEDYATLPQPSSPRWSPDGKRIAYVLTKADLEKSAYDSNVRVIDTDGKNDRQLTFARGADFRPRWSPDGKHLAFVSDRDGKNAIWLL